MSDSQSPSESMPVLSLDLRGYPDLVLNLGRESLLSDPKLLIKTHEKSRPVTLFLDGLQGDDWGFNVVTALEHGLLLLLDAETEDVISIPPRDSPARSRTIKPIAIEEVHTISFHPRHDIWRTLVKNGQTYLIKFAESGGLSWCQYGPKEEYLGHLDRHRPDSLPLRRGSECIKFSVRDDPPPPIFSASLSTSSNVCHLSAGFPTFELIISITSHETQPITVAVEDTPFYIAQGLNEIFDIQDKETNERVEMPSGAGCFMDNTGSDDYPPEMVLEEFLPDEPYIRKYALEPFDEASSNGGELECLTEDHNYLVRLSQTVVRGFSSWQFGLKIDLPRDGKEKRRRFRGNGTIKFAVSDVPVEFRAEK
ncbi:MAG: hypothetical protein M1830_001827 [Pleopsidium flavum]|nr:MAG: hypothetical protein M1830_001827 [Pleopsidium flavum]